MEREAFAFGDQATADVILTLIQEEGTVHPLLYVHSKALKKSEFFDAMLSKRWTSNSEASNDSSPVEFKVSCCGKNPKDYVRCIQLMYSLKNATFASVQEAISLLEIASELLFHECVNLCLRYLEAVPWSTENELQIQLVLGSLQLQVPPDLRARLSGCVMDLNPADTMGEILSELLNLVSNGAPPKARDIAKGVLKANDHSPAFANVNKLVLFKELQGNLEVVKGELRKFSNFFSWNSHQIGVASSALLWLLDEFFELGMAEMAIKTFAEEHELAQLMVTRIYQNPFTDILYCILVRLLQALKAGKVITPKSVRMSLLITWLPVVAKHTRDDEYLVNDNELHRDLEEGLSSLVVTLPIVDQEQVFKIWISSCLKFSRRAWPDLSVSFDSWCNKLRQAQDEKDLVSSEDASSPCEKIL